MGALEKRIEPTSIVRRRRHQRFWHLAITNPHVFVAVQLLTMPSKYQPFYTIYCKKKGRNKECWHLKKTHICFWSEGKKKQGDSDRIVINKGLMSIDSEKRERVERGSNITFGAPRPEYWSQVPSSLFLTLLHTYRKICFKKLTH